MALFSGAAIALLASGPVAAAPTARLRIAATGTYSVGVLDFTFVDHSRPTQANRSFPGSPERTLPTVVYYPARGSIDDVVDDAAPDRRHRPYPIILYSHGTDSFGREYEPLFRQWVSAGYVVVAPDYPLAKKTAPGGATVTDLAQQPADAKFVLDHVLALDRKRSSPLHGIIDSAGVAASGHSLGAITTYDLAYKTCCADRRITAVAIMSGVTGKPPEYFRDIHTPLLVLHGDADATLPIRLGAEAFAVASPPKYFVTLIAGQHSAPYRGADDAVATATARTTLDFFDRYLKGDPGGIDRLERDADVAGVATLQEDR